MTAVVWVGALVAFLALLERRAERVSYLGLARSVTYQVSPVTAGTVEEVLFDLYEPVEAGAVVATLDARHLLARIETARTMIGGLRAELEATRAMLEGGSAPDQLDRRAELRRFAVDVERRRIEELALVARIESEAIEERRLALEKRRFERLHSEGIVSDAEWDDARLRHATVARRLEEDRRRLAELRRERQAAAARLAQFEGDSASAMEAALAPLRRSVDVAEKQLVELQVEREWLLLRSPVAGKVEGILARRGQAVVAGQPVVSIAAAYATEVVAYLPEESPRRLRPGQPVRVARLDRPIEARSMVLRIGPRIELIPPRLRRNPALAEYGRPFVASASAELRLLPGEVVEVAVTPEDGSRG